MSTEPAAGQTVTPVPVSVTLCQGPKDFGWIDLTLRFGDQDTLITMSEVYDPFSSLLAWLQAVHEGDLPIGIDIDEENEICRISAHPFSDRLLLISAFDRYFKTMSRLEPSPTKLRRLDGFYGGSVASVSLICCSRLSVAGISARGPRRLPLVKLTRARTR